MPLSARKYVDLDLDFLPHPVTGDILKKKDAVAVVTSIKNLLLTSFYERPFQPQIGSNLNKMLFEPMGVSTSHELRKEIENVISKFEPRADVKQVIVTPDDEAQRYDVTIVFFVLNDAEPITVNLFLERVR
jgi:phage baseplate assembly protein W